MCPSHQPSSENVKRQRGDERGREPGEPDHDEQVGDAPREQVRAQRAQRQDPEEHEPEREQREGLVAVRGGHVGQDRRVEEAGDAEPEDRGEQHDLQDEERLDAAQERRQREGGEREDRGARRKRQRRR